MCKGILNMQAKSVVKKIDKEKDIFLFLNLTADSY